MSSLTARRLNQFSFFGILLTGVVAFFGVYPLFPSTIRIDLATGLVVVVAGFVAGQVLHVVATVLQKLIGRLTRFDGHRERFASEVVEPEFVAPELAKKFRRRCEIEFDVPSASSDENRYRPLWPLVVGYLHSMNSWTPTMQALFSFCRSLLVLSVSLIAFYLVFGLAQLGGLVPFETVYEANNLRPRTFFSIALGVLVSSTLVFSVGTYEYMRYMIEYAIVEFVADTGM